MLVSNILILIVIGIVAGTLSGLIGIGGGIVIVPLLVAILHFSQQQAQGTSLAMILLPTGILAVYNYYQKGYVSINSALWIAVGFLGGAYLGSKLAISLPQESVKRIFGGIMVLYGIKLLLGK